MNKKSNSKKINQPAALIYCRVSSKSQKEEYLEFESQEARCRAFQQSKDPDPPVIKPGSKKDRRSKK